MLIVFYKLLEILKIGIGTITKLKRFVRLILRKTNIDKNNKLLLFKKQK